MTRFFLRHPVGTWMIFTAFLVLGIYALPKLRIEALPEIELPTLSVSTRWNGASPEAVQRSITLPIEEAVGRVHGVEKVSSTSSAGNSRVEVALGRDIDIDFARVELNEQLGAVRRNLPLGANQPEILPYVPEEFQTDDFFTFSLEGELSANSLREMAETWIVPRLLALEGVADARVQGGARPLLRVVLDRRRLERYGITADEVFRVLDSLDRLQGAGVVRQDGLEKLVALRTPVDRATLEQTVVARRGGRNYRLRTLGSVREGFEDPDTFVRADGRNVVRIAVEKRSGANTVAVSGTLRRELPRIREALPIPALFHIDDDQGNDLREKLTELVYRSLVILAVLFVLLVLSLRQVRLTAIVIASILFAIVISLSLFYFFRLSVNFITISGLTICFGLILDNSILVLDSIHRRLGALERAEEAGLSRRAKLKVAIETIVAGSDEVIFPILATTLTTVVAFLSFIFLSGRLALFYVPLAIAVTTAMIASIFVAFAWIPVALNQGWAARLVRRAPDGPVDAVDTAQIHGMVEDLPDLASRPSGIERVFQGAQRLWWLILPPVTAVVLVAGTTPLPDYLPIYALSTGTAKGGSLLHRVLSPGKDGLHVVRDSVALGSYLDDHAAWFPRDWIGYVYREKVLKGGFFRLPDQKELLLYLQMPAGTDVKVTSQQLMKFEQAILPVASGARATSNAFGNQAVLRIKFDDPLLKTEIPTAYRLALVDVADVTGGSSIFIRGFSDRPYVKGSFGGSGLNSLVKITGYNSKHLNAIADAALARLKRQRRVRNARITSGTRFGRGVQEETVLTIDRDALARHNLSVLEVVGYIRRLLGSDTPWNMLVDGKRQRMQLAFDDADDIQYSDVAGKTIVNARGEKVKLMDLVSLETRPMKGSITRENQRYTMFLNWEYVGTDKMRRNYIRKTLAEIQVPYGYTAEEATQEFFTQEEEEDLRLTILLAVVFIFMILAALFESVSLPVLVLLSLPLALSGVFTAFWVREATFDSSARIGLVLLFGIVVNNAILLVSRFRTEASLILRARLGGDPEGNAALFPGLRKQLGGSDLIRIPASERAALLRRAVARGTQVRLRSILLTSSTTIVGLIPLLVKFGQSEGQDIWENLALSSIGGLVSSTVLLVLALPPLYYACIRIKWGALGILSFVRRRLRRPGSKEHPVPRPAPGI